LFDFSAAAPFEPTAEDGVLQRPDEMKEFTQSHLTAFLLSFVILVFGMIERSHGNKGGKRTASF
jgi:hypothetical protein